MLTLLSRRFFISNHLIASAAFFNTNTISMSTDAATTSLHCSNVVKPPTTTSSCSAIEDVMSLVHPIGLGTYLMEREKMNESLRTAIDAGYRRIDCAPVYFNEDAIGDALELILNDNAIQREDLFIVSKLPSPFHTNPKIALQKILNDLKLSYLDLFLSKLTKCIKIKCVCH